MKPTERKWQVLEWEVVEGPGDVIYINALGYGIVCHVTPGAPSDRRDIARLISTAPELLAAAKLASACHDLKGIREALAAAIAKAEPA